MLQITPVNLLIGFMLLFCNFQLLAQTLQEKQLPCHANQHKLDNAVKKAIPINRVSPKYPMSAARSNQEGWVRLSFVVKEDGSVDLPIIEDSSGIKSFEKAAKRAIKAWTFDPATRNGKTIEQCQNSVQLDFKMGKSAKGATRKFIRQYRKIMKLLNDNELKEAKIAIDQLAKTPRQNFYEDKFFFSMKARYYQATGDIREELANLKKIIPQGKDYLPKNSYTYDIARAFQLALLNNELSSALYFYDQLSQFNPEHEVFITLTPYTEKINALIDGSENIHVIGEINQREHWNHYLARNSFTFANINGELSTVDIRCDNHFSTYSVDSEKQWDIPESWGKCKLFVHGKQGAKFDLIEVANKPT